MADALVKDSSIPPNLSETVSKIVRDELTNFTNYSGIANKNQLEIITNFHQTDGEVVLRGKTNSFIVIGRDRTAGIGSGKGGSGHNQASSIDLIAGHGGTRPVDQVNGTKILSDKNFSADSARIYISQKCDLDKTLGLPRQSVKVSETTKVDININDGRSGIGAKADSICLVGRENIKICTMHHESNARGKEIHPGGIDIIAGIDDLKKSLIPQPMVKGNNLKEMLEKILVSLQDLQSSVTNFIDLQNSFNNLTIDHAHQLISTSVTDSPIQKSQMSLINKDLLNQTTFHLTNMISYQTLAGTYLTDGKEKSINSQYNRVN